MKITRLRISSYRGIEELDTSIPSAGVIVSGTNDRCKTTVLRAIQAALSGQDIGPQAIKLGAERAEILVDLEDLSVQRVITPGGSKVSVERDLGGARAKIPSPAKFLRDLLGISSIDPIDLISAKTAEERRTRRAKVLAAVPAHVTAEQIQAWTGECVRSIDPNTHGLEVVAQLRQHYYDKRTEANARAKEARRKADEIYRETVKLPPIGEDPSTDEILAKYNESVRILDRLEARAKDAAEAEERTRATRERVADLRKHSASIAAPIASLEPTDEEMEKSKTTVASWRARVNEIEAELNEAKAALDKAEAYASRVQMVAAECAAAHRRSEELCQQATDLESAISAAVVEPPSEQTLQSARENVSEWNAEVARAQQRDANDMLRQRAHDAEQAAKANEGDALHLDGVVRRLTNDAPAEILASANGIPGLSVDGDSLSLDGVDLDGLNGKKQLQFAIDIAKRANSRAKILICDGLERIASDQLEEFVRLCTNDGWQLLCTRVTTGDRVIEAIQP
jgi:hypothetical protein